MRFRHHAAPANVMVAVSSAQVVPLDVGWTVTIQADPAYGRVDVSIMNTGSMEGPLGDIYAEEALDLADALRAAATLAGAVPSIEREAIACALYDHWRRDSPDVGPWEEATSALRAVFHGQADAVLAVAVTS